MIKATLRLQTSSLAAVSALNLQATSYCHVLPSGEVQMRGNIEAHDKESPFKTFICLQQQVS